MKKTVIIILVVLLVAAAAVGAYFLWFAPKSCFDISADDVEQIILQNGNTGQYGYYYSEEDIAWFVQRLNGLKYAKSYTPSEARDGWTYALIIETEDESIRCELKGSIVDIEGTLYHLTDDSLPIIKKLEKQYTYMPPAKNHYFNLYAGYVTGVTLRSLENGGLLYLDSKDAEDIDWLALRLNKLEYTSVEIVEKETDPAKMVVGNHPRLEVSVASMIPTGQYRYNQYDSVKRSCDFYAKTLEVSLSGDKTAVYTLTEESVKIVDEIFERFYKN